MLAKKYDSEFDNDYDYYDYGYRIEKYDSEFDNDWDNDYGNYLRSFDYYERFNNGWG